MYRMYIDDEREPIGESDVICRTSKSAIKAFKQKYKEGERHFFLELDHDSGDTMFELGKCATLISTFIFILVMLWVEKI